MIGIPARTDRDGRLSLGGGGPEHPLAGFPDQATFLVSQLGGPQLHDPGESIEVKHKPRSQALFGSPGTRDRRGQLDVRPLLASADDALGDVLTTLGRTEEAAAMLRNARDKHLELGNQTDAEDCAAQLATLT